MKIILGGKHLRTPIGSSVSIQGSMSDAVPKCNVSLYDEDSSFVVQCPQEMIVLDEKRIAEPTINLLRNPALDPYTTEWTVFDGAVSGVTLSTVSGGGIKYTFSNAANAAYKRVGEYTFQASIVGGERYRASFYVLGESTPTNIDALLQVVVIDVANTQVLSETHYFSVSTSLTRYDVSITAPSDGNIFFAVSGHTTSATNSGAMTFTKVQLEPEWFDTQSYPTAWCGPAQTNCRQLPSGLWIRQYRKFAGFVVNPSYEEYHGNSRTINIQAVGYAWIMSTIYPAETYTNQYDSAIIADLLSNYLTSTDPRGGTPSYTMAGTANIVQGILLANFVVPRDDMKTVANNLASQIGFYWTIGAYWEFVYAPPGYFVSLYSLICDNSETPDMVTTFPAYDFHAEEDFTQPGSNILIIGGGTNVAQVIDPVQINLLGNISGYFLPTLSSWMRKVQATELGNIADCNQRGVAELLQYSQTRKLYKLTTDACELIAGQAISVTSVTDGLNKASLLLQSVTARWMGTDETLNDKWEYQADLGAVNRQVQNILNRLFKTGTKSSTAPSITQTSLVLFERIGVIDGAVSATPDTSYQATILSEGGLLACYRLNQLLGSEASDYSGHARHGTINGGVTLGTSGLLTGGDKAMTFDGSSGYISLPTSFIPTSSHAWTIECWCKITSFVSGGHVMVGMGTSSSGETAQILYTSNGTTAAFQLSTFGTDITGPTTLSTGTIYHVVGTYDGTNIRLYMNGSLIAGPLSASLNLVATFALIGAQGTGPNEFFNGVVDEVAIYNASLTSSQISNHYTAGTT